MWNASDVSSVDTDEMRSDVKLSITKNAIKTDGASSKNFPSKKFRYEGIYFSSNNFESCRWPTCIPLQYCHLGIYI